MCQRPRKREKLKYARAHYLCYLSRHTVVCQRPRKREKLKYAWAHYLCYLRDWSSSRFQPIITQKLWRLFLPILHILMSPYTAPYIPNLRGIAPAVPEIRAPETCRILFVFFFFFFAPNNKVARKLCSCSPISTKFGTRVALSKNYMSTNLVRFAVKLRKIWAIVDKNFNQFVDTPTRKTVGAIVLKFLWGTNLTLKVDRFDGFVNRSSTADLWSRKQVGVIFTIFLKRGAYILMVEINHFISIYGGTTRWAIGLGLVTRNCSNNRSILSNRTVTNIIMTAI